MLFQAVATEINQRSATVVVFQLISCKFPKVFPPNGGICPKIVLRLWELPLWLLYWGQIDFLSWGSPNLAPICIKVIPKLALSPNLKGQCEIPPTNGSILFTTNVEKESNIGIV